MTLPDQNPSDYWFLDEHAADVCCKIGRLVGGVTASNIVSLVPSRVLPLRNEYQHGQQNRVIQLTDTDVYAITSDGLWKSTNVGSSFTLTHSWTNTASADLTHLAKGHWGPFRYLDAGTEYLVGVKQVGVGQYYQGWKYETGTGSMTFTNSVLTFTYPGQGSLWHRNLFLFDLEGQEKYYNPATMTFGAVSYTGVLTGSEASRDKFVGEDGSPWMWVCATGGKWNLARYNGSAWVQQACSFTHIATNNILLGADNKCAAFIDPETGTTAFFYVTNVGTSYSYIGWAVEQRSDPYTSVTTDVGTVVLPSELLVPAEGGTAGTTSPNRCYVMYDTQTNPNTPAVFLYFNRTLIGGFSSCYQWKGFNDPMRFVGNVSGAQWQNAHSNEKIGGGGRIVGNGSVRGSATAGDPEGRNTKITFKLDGTGSTYTVRLRFRKSKAHPWGQCTLAAGSALGGGSVSGNTITGVTADGADNTVEWDLTADGVVSGDEGVALVVEVEV